MLKYFNSKYLSACQSLFLIFAILAMSCTQQEMKEEKIEIKKYDLSNDREVLNDLLKNLEEPSQIFTVSPSGPHKIIGKKGTIIYLDPAKLESENGQPLTKEIRIELKELTTAEELMRANAQTISQGKLLVSGGAYYINMTSGGEQLKIKNGKSLRVQFPKIINEKMEMFYGNRDSMGQMQWAETGQNFISKKSKENILLQPKIDTVMYITHDVEKNQSRDLQIEEKPTEQEKADRKITKRDDELTQKVYDAIDIKQFGWINIDRFYNFKNKTDLSFTFKQSDSITLSNVYLLFKDVNCVMGTTYTHYENVIDSAIFRNIPLGSEISVFALSVSRGNVSGYTSDLTIHKNQVIELPMKKLKEGDIKQFFKYKEFRK